jgi:hypothetical protein
MAWYFGLARHQTRICAQLTLAGLLWVHVVELIGSKGLYRRPGPDVLPG